MLATPARAQLMLLSAGGKEDVDPSVFTDPRLLPKAKIYVHVAEETLLTGRGPVRVEGVGALPAAMLRTLLGHTRVKVAPVIRPYAAAGVDCYEIPARIRRQVVLRDAFEVFPWSSRPARSQDLDHTIPYRRDAPEGAEQTRPDNLGPLSRRVHRGKTFGGWQLEQPRPGVFHWTSPGGIRYRVDPHGTHRLGKDPALDALDELLWHDDVEPPVGDDPDPPDTG